MRKQKAISIKSSPEFFNLMETERLKLRAKGIRASQSDLTRMIAMNLQRKRRGLGLMKDVRTKKTKKK